MPDELYTHLSKFKGKELERQIEKVRNIRDGIFFEVENKVIDKFELISKKQLKLLFKDHYFLVMGKKSKKVDIFEEYTTDKQKKDVLLVKTKNMKNGLPIYFFAEIDSNLDKKHEEYLKALGEGKKIVDIV